MLRPDDRQFRLIDDLRRAASVSLMVALLGGCASSGKVLPGRSCPGMEVLLKVERTAKPPTYRCVSKADLEYLFERPTDPRNSQHGW